MSAPTVKEQANAVAKQRLREDARSKAELDIARELCGYSVECSEDGPRKIACIYDNDTCVAMFTALSWRACIAAAHGWSEAER